MIDGPDDGVLANLPRSRPGNRSAKRDATKRAQRPEPAVPAAPARAGRPRPAAASAAPAVPESVRPGPRAGEPRPRSASARPAEIEAGAPPSLVDMGVRATEAWIGIVWFWPRVAMHVTGAVLRRLPRLF